MGYGLWGLGFTLWGSGFGVLGFRFWVSGFGVQGLGVLGSHSVWGLGLCLGEPRSRTLQASSCPYDFVDFAVAGNARALVLNTPGKEDVRCSVQGDARFIHLGRSTFHERYTPLHAAAAWCPVFSVHFASQLSTHPLCRSGRLSVFQVTQSISQSRSPLV